MIKNTLPDKLGNAEIEKKIHYRHWKYKEISAEDDTPVIQVQLV